MEQVRTFIAVELTDRVKAEIGSVEEQLQKAGGDIKWVRPDNVHITLKFLGEIPAERLDDVYAGVETCAAKASPFHFALGGLGTFPNRRRPRVIWIGLQRGVDELGELQHCLETTLESHGFPSERRAFSPHLTIGRVRSPRGIEDVMEKMDQTEYTSSEVVAVNSLTVMRSVLTPKGPIYTPLHKGSLSGKSPAP